MKKYGLVFLIGFVFLNSGCGRKKVVQERICSRIDFERIVALFPKTVAEIQSLVQRSKEDMDIAIDSIGQITPLKRTYQNTPLVYEQAYFQLILNQYVLQVLAVASDNAQLQAEAFDAFRDLDNYRSDVLLRNLTLYQAFEQYQRLGIDTYRKNISTHYFLRNVVQRFEEEGMHLSVAKRAELVLLEKEIKNLQHHFYNNVIEDTASLSVPVKKLHGVPEQFLSSLSKNLQDDYMLPLNYETYAMVMQHCLVEATRKSYYLAFMQKAHVENQPILQKLIDKRNEFAKKLDFKDFATYQLSDLMAKNPKKVEEFLWKTVKKLQTYEEKNFEALTKDLPPSVTLVGLKNQIKPWDYDLIQEWYRKNNFEIVDNNVSEYFSLDIIIPILLQKFGQFFHVEFEPQKVVNMWTSDLFCYRVRSLKNQSIIGYIFLDLYQRPLKKIQKPSYMMIIPSIRDDCSISCVGSTVLMANFAKPTADKPTLLKFHELNALMYEMGHVFHAIFGSTRFSQFSGPLTDKDFTNVPSLMLQYWLEDPDFLSAIGRHYKTGALLSKEMIEKIIALQKFNRADCMLKQLFLSLVSLNLFRKTDEKNMHSMIEKIYKKVFKHIAYESDDYFETIFMPFVDESGAIFYVHPWSQMIAADLFIHIKKEGMDNYKTGERYVGEVLSSGGSKHPQEMIRRFLGRNWNSEAYFESLR